MTFEEWIAALDAEARRIGYGSGSYSGMTGLDCWRDAYDDGMTPTDALAEDIIAGAS